MQPTIIITQRNYNKIKIKSPEIIKLKVGKHNEAKLFIFSHQVLYEEAGFNGSFKKIAKWRPLEYLILIGKTQLQRKHTSRDPNR